MKNSGQILKVLLLVFGLSQVVIGALAFFAGPYTESVIKVLYGATVNITPQLTHVIRMFGVYIFIIGLLALFAAKDPAQNQVIIYSVIGLLGLRVIQRLVFAQQIQASFGIPVSRNLINAALFLAFGVLLFIFRPKD
ncbi:MAG: hypothetical protein HQ564_09920 [Candidatus Saganbacteria bacterium]|nr:hypothetical protein [Candidatus Saganbacteria bacterium]